MPSRVICRNALPVRPQHLIEAAVTGVLDDLPGAKPKGVNRVLEFNVDSDADEDSVRLELARDQLPTGADALTDVSVKARLERGLIISLASWTPNITVVIV